MEYQRKSFSVATGGRDASVCAKFGHGWLRPDGRCVYCNELVVRITTEAPNEVTKPETALATPVDGEGQSASDQGNADRQQERIGRAFDSEGKASPPSEVEQAGPEQPEGKDNDSPAHQEAEEVGIEDAAQATRRNG
jgi:hypothetical protein